MKDEEVNFWKDVTAEQAFTIEPSPEAIPITKEE